jgi:hypothetical protein
MNGLAYRKITFYKIIAFQLSFQLSIKFSSQMITFHIQDFAEEYRKKIKIKPIELGF